MNKKALLRQSLSVYLLALVCCIVITLPALSRYTWRYQSIIAAFLWVYIPSIVLIVRRENFDEYGITLKGCSNGARAIIIVALLSLLLFAAGYGLCQTVLWGGRFVPRLSPAWPHIFLFQLVLLALPEEYFFRGYLQTNLNRVWGYRWRLFGAHCGPALLASALLFALAHAVIDRSWIRLSVFFPALVFGWMRERNGTILAPVIYHALCNVTLIALQHSFTMR